MCEYLGLSAVKAELEDICFAVLEPLRFQKVYEDRASLLAGKLSSKAKVRTSAAVELEVVVANAVTGQWAAATTLNAGSLAAVC